MVSFSSPAYRCFVGVDIAAASFTAIWSTDGTMLPRAVTFAQTPTGFAAFQQQLQATGVTPAQTLIVLEATGSYIMKVRQGGGESVDLAAAVTA